MLVGKYIHNQVMLFCSHTGVLKSSTLGVIQSESYYKKFFVCFHLCHKATCNIVIKLTRVTVQLFFTGSKLV